LIELIKAVQDLLDRKKPPTCVNDDDDDHSESDDDGYIPRTSNSNFNKASEEFDLLESYKRNRYRPKKWKTTASTVLSDFDMNSGKIEEIIVAPVEENGKDLPSGRNLGNYIDTKGGWMCYTSTRITRNIYPICGSLSSGRQQGVLLRLDVSDSLVFLAMFRDQDEQILG
jgi:hypothetical protein